MVHSAARTSRGLDFRIFCHLGIDAGSATILDLAIRNLSIHAWRRHSPRCCNRMARLTCCPIGIKAAFQYLRWFAHLCSVLADCVTKLIAALRESKNRIRLKDILNQCCALAFVLESILLFLVVKIVLQHNLPGGDSCTAANGVSIEHIYH